MNGTAPMDMTGLDLRKKDDSILGIQIPKKEIPVSPGRNIPLLIEVAAYRDVINKFRI